MREVLIGNPLGWVQAKLLGGWRRALTVGIVYFTFALGLMLILYRAVPLGVTQAAAISSFTRVALIIISVLQGVLFLFVASGTISKAVQRDMTTGIIDSHRLTPMSGWAAVLGYLSGPTVMIAPITIANIVLVFGVSVLGGHPPLVWLLGMLIAFCSGLSLASLNLLVALCTKKSTNLLGLLIILSIFTSATIVFLIPGLGLLTGFFSGAAMLARMGTPQLDPWSAVALLGQVVLGVLACLGAARKYLRPDVPAFSWPLGIILLAYTSIFAALGIRQFPEYAASFGRWSIAQMNPAAQWISSSALVMLVALLPIATGMRARARWLRHRALSPATAGRPPAPAWIPLLLALVTPAIVAYGVLRGAFGPASPPEAGPARIAWPMLAFYCLALIPLAAVYRAGYEKRDRAAWNVVIWIVVFWVLPAVVDLGRAVYAESDSDVPVSWLLGFSPIGAWALIATSPEIPLRPGLCFNAALCAAAWIAVPVLRRRRERRALPELAPPPRFDLRRDAGPSAGLQAAATPHSAASTASPPDTIQRIVDIGNSGAKT